MAEAWLPGAGRLHIKEGDGGKPKGGAPRAVWHTTETDPRLVSGRSAAQSLLDGGRSAHLVWNPRSGEIVQLMPANRAARMLDPAVGREGRVCLQILVVGLSSEPFTGAPPLHGLTAIMAWLDTWKVPRAWPAGPPLQSPQAFHSPRVRRIWARGGHYAASQVPETVSDGPGGIDVRAITGPHTVLAMPMSRPATVHAIRPYPEARPLFTRPDGDPADGNRRDGDRPDRQREQDREHRPRQDRAKPDRTVPQRREAPAIRADLEHSLPGTLAPQQRHATEPAERAPEPAERAVDHAEYSSGHAAAGSRH